MPVVDLDDELSIVNEAGEGLEASPPVDDSDLENSVYMKSDMSHMSGMQSGIVSRNSSEDEREQQWIINNMLHHQDSPTPSNPVPPSGSDTDDSSLYLMDLDGPQLEEKKQEAKKKKSAKNKQKAPSKEDEAYKNYMDVSGIVEHLGEEEEQEGWRKMVPSLRNVSKANDSSSNNRSKKALGRSNGEDEEKTQAKESWRNKNPFRGKMKKSSEQAQSNEANLAPLGNFDDVAKKVEAKNEGWMPKMSFLGKSKTSESTKDDQFENLYAANLAPLGGIDDVETSLGDDGSVGEMTAVVSNKAETEAKENIDDLKASSDVLEKSLGFAMSIMASLNIDTSPMVEETVDHDEERGPFLENKEHTLAVKKGSDDTDEAKEEIVEETEGSFVGSDDKDANEENEEGLLNSNFDMEANDDSSGTTKGKKSWKSKVKSVRKKSGLSSICKKGGKLRSKNFTQEKMKAMETAGDDKTIGTLSTKRSVTSFGKNDMGGTNGGRRKKRIIIAIAVVLFAAIIAGAIAGSLSRGSSDDVTTSDTPPKDIMYLFKLLYPISGDYLEVQDPESPLVKSFVWVAEDNKARPDDSDEEIILRYVAAVVYYSLGGENWTNQNNFLSHDNLCMWNDAGATGIICNDGIYELQLCKYPTRNVLLLIRLIFAHILSLLLPLAGNNLSGEIPDEIRHLASLKHIYMADNAINGTLPSAIGELGWLKVLDLSSNSMKGKIPKSLFHYKQLREIILNGNNFSGTINPSIGDSPVLERFSASGNSLSGNIPDSIGTSSILKIIDLTDNDLTGTIPSFPASSSIEGLYLGMNGLEGPIPDSLARTPTLQYLHVPKNSLVGTIPDFSKNERVLRGIDISGNELKGNIAKLFESLPSASLEKIIISDNEITGTLPSSIGDFKELTQLQIVRNNILGPIPTEIGQLAKLSSLRLRLNKLTGTIPTEMGALVLLTDLLLDSNELEGVIPEEVASLPQLGK